MYSVDSHLRVLLALFIIGAVAAAFTGSVYETYLKIKTRSALTMAFATWLVCGAVIFYRVMRRVSLWGRLDNMIENGLFQRVIAGGLIVVFAVPFIAKLYRAWGGGFVTEAEKAPGMDGVRAWLGKGNLVCVVGISLCAWQGYEYSFWGALVLTLIALLAYPMLTMLSSHPPLRSAEPPRTTSGDLAPERERVLRLLEEGKIDADESAELLNALGETVQPIPSPVIVATTPGRRLALIGATAVTVGFFLPWFSVDLGKEMQRMQSMMGQINPMPQMNFNQLNQTIQTEQGTLHVQWPGQTPPPPSPGGSTVSIAGGDIANGLGWFILLLAAGAAVLPYVATGLKPDAQRNITYGALVIGSLLLAYQLTRSIQYASFGIAIVVLGYAAAWVGAVREYKGYGEPVARIVTS